MREVADGVFQLEALRGYTVNAYLVGDALIDAGIKQSAKKLLKHTRGVATTIALTHAHPDHAGAAARLKQELGAQYAVGERDVESAERGWADGRFGVAERPFSKYPKAPVDRVLREGDDVAGFTVLDTPGHSIGHVSFWRESDRVLICGDVFFNMSLLTLRPGLTSPPWVFTPDPETNRASQRRLASLGPRVVLFGHGPVLTDDAAGKLHELVGP